MTTYILRRLLYAIPVLAVSSFLIFIFVSSTTDPLETLKRNPRGDQHTLKLVEHKYHLDRPSIVRYGYWVRDVFTRQFGQTTLIASNDKLSGDLLKMHSGVCFGDSGGPDLLPGTNVVLGVNSFVNDGVCAGVTYSARVDTPAVLAWIAAASSRFAT